MAFRKRTNNCPECGHANPKGAHRCLACGSVIGGNDQPTVPGVQFGLDEPEKAVEELPEIDLHLPVFPLDEPSAPPEPTPATGGELLWSDIAEPAHERVAADRAAAAPARASPPELISTDPRPLTREGRRAITRREVTSRAASPASAGAPPDVLVLDPNEVVRTQLTVWLERFGFRVHSESSADRALATITTRHFAAGFLGAPLEGSGAEHTLALVQAARNGHGQGRCGLVFIDSAGRPSDRVRANFAGFDAVIGQPIGRGAVARTLEEIGLMLPRDERLA